MKLTSSCCRFSPKAMENSECSQLPCTYQPHFCETTFNIIITIKSLSLQLHHCQIFDHSCLVTCEWNQWMWHLMRRNPDAISIQSISFVYAVIPKTSMQSSSDKCQNLFCVVPFSVWPMISNWNDTALIFFQLQLFYSSLLILPPSHLISLFIFHAL